MVMNKLLVQKLGPDIPPHVDLAAGAPEENAIRCLLAGCFAVAAEDRPSARDVLSKLEDVAAKRAFQILESNEEQEFKQIESGVDMSLQVF